MSSDLIPLVFLGGLLALDATSVGQFMVSRPLVAGALAGWLTGEPALGVATGGILELYLLVAFPTGGSRFPEGATATVVAVASVAGVEHGGALPVGIALALFWGRLGGLSIVTLRKLNGRFVPEANDEGVTPRRVTTAHLSALSLDFARACVVTLSGIVAGRLIVPWAAAHWPMEAGDSRGLLLVGAAVSAGILLRSLGGFRRRRILFVAGLAMGILGARLL